MTFYSHYYEERSLPTLLVYSSTYISKVGPHHLGCRRTSPSVSDSPSAGEKYWNAIRGDPEASPRQYSRGGRSGSHQCFHVLWVSVQCYRDLPPRTTREDTSRVRCPARVGVSEVDLYGSEVKTKVWKEGIVQGFKS